MKNANNYTVRALASKMKAWLNLQNALNDTIEEVFGALFRVSYDDLPAKLKDFYGFTVCHGTIQTGVSALARNGQAYALVVSAGASMQVRKVLSNGDHIILCGWHRGNTLKHGLATINVRDALDNCTEAELKEVLELLPTLSRRLDAKMKNVLRVLSVEKNA